MWDAEAGALARRGMTHPLWRHTLHDQQTDRGTPTRKMIICASRMLSPLPWIFATKKSRRPPIPLGRRLRLSLNRPASCRVHVTGQRNPAHRAMRNVTPP
jgi:hypothetical protein